MEFDQNEEKALALLQEASRYSQRILEDEDKLERFLQQLERKLELVPVVGTALAEIPVMISMVRCFAKKEYTDVPAGTLLSVIGALLYFLSPVDFVPDYIPVAGLADDAAVIGVCLKLIDSDIRDYRRWRKDTGWEIF